jgi:hypothetical protein
MSNRKITLRLAGILGLAAVTLTGALISPVYAGARDSRGGGGHDRGGRHYGGYRGGGGGYYAGPPVVYQPYGYYAQPGASVNLNFPLRF